MNHYIKIGLYIARFFVVGLITLAALEILVSYFLSEPEDSLLWLWGLLGNLIGFGVFVWMVRELKKSYKFIKESDNGLKDKQQLNSNTNKSIFQ